MGGKDAYIFEDHERVHSRDDGEREAFLPILGSGDNFARAFAGDFNNMAVDIETVVRVARLARLKVPEGDLETLAGELSNIIGWIEQLDEVDTDGVEPMASVADMKLRWRADEVTDGGIPDKVTSNAPDPQNGMFSVPKVVE